MAISSICARDLMNDDVKTVSETLSIRELSQLLQGWAVSGAPVVDEGGRPVGVVSVTDIAHAGDSDSVIVTDRSDPDFFVRSWDERFNPEDLRKLHLEDEGLLVCDIMTPNLCDVAADAPISEVVESMLSAHVHRILVTDNDQVVGIISTFDVLEQMNEPSGEALNAVVNF